MIEAVEFWNEPNNLSHWDFELDPEWREFAEMTSLAAGRVRELAPDLTSCSAASRRSTPSGVLHGLLQDGIREGSVVLDGVDAAFVRPRRRRGSATGGRVSRTG